jgi:dsDNA-specific endonuclease/ATPase MutS2
MEGRIKYVEEEQKAMNTVIGNQEQIKRECEKQFEDVIPLLKEAVNGLKRLSKAEVTELKSIKKPT